MNEEPMLTEPTASSPQSVVDNASIANCMNKNKESLKLKLMLRRPIDVLVDQGILPPPNSSPTFYEQKLKLERAKTGDYLKHKIQRRPQRDELVQQHILEEAFDPYFYEQERKLKRARLADDLNERLSHRPGPLELIKGNILHTDQFLEQAIKDGQITFKKTCEGEIIKNPPKRFVFEEESSSDSAPSPSLQNSQNVNSSSSGITTSSTFIVSNSGSLVSIAPIQQSVNKVIPTAANVFNGTNLSYIVSTPVTSVLSNTSTVFITTNNNSQDITSKSSISVNNSNSSVNLCSQKINDSYNIGPTKSIQNAQNPKTKKKLKSKTIPKARVIKFHEYTGPPNARKPSNSNQSCPETSYELLLKQQQLYLQWQLESQQNLPQQINQDKNPSIGSTDSISNLSPILNSDDLKNLKNNISDSPSIAQTIQPEELSRKSLENSFERTSVKLDNKNKSTKNSVPSVKKIISKLEDMKVSDLKAELKKRNLPVSGAKQQLIERLKPFTEAVVINNNAIVTAELNGNNGENHNCNIPEQRQTQKFIYRDICANNLGGAVTNPTTIILNNGSTQNFISNNDMINGKTLNEKFVLVANSNENFQTVPVQLKSNNPIALDGSTTLTIPIGNTTFIPQYQVVSSANPNDQKIRINGLNSIQPTQALSTNNILINNNLHEMNNATGNLNNSSSLNYTPTLSTLPEANSSNITLLTPPHIQLAQIDDRLSLNCIGSTILPNINNKLVGIQNSGPIIHQLLLYPNTINASNPESISPSKHNRSNSLPSESLHPLQRNTSLPLIINQMPIPQIPIDSNFKLIKIDNAPLSNDRNENVSTMKTNSLTTKGQRQIANGEIESNKFQTFAIEQEKTSVDDSSNMIVENTSNLVSTTNSISLSKDCLENNNSIMTADNSSSNIQPDSTTNNNLDLDFMLNFDYLNGFDEVNVKPELSNNDNNFLATTATTTKTKEDKNNDIIDFNDNWLDFTFNDNSNYLPENTVSKPAENVANMNNNNNSDNNYCDNDIFDTINQIFDNNNLTPNQSANTGVNCNKLDSSLKNDTSGSSSCISGNHNLFNGYTDNCNSDDNNVDHNINLLNNFSQYELTSNNDNNNNNNPQISNKNVNINNNNNFFSNNSHNSAVNTSIDLFGDLFFEENDFKNSMDFPILLDKIDFAT